MNLSSFVLLVTAIITMYVVSKNSTSFSSGEKFILDDTMKKAIQEQMIGRNFVYKNDDGTYHINDLNVHAFIEMQNDAHQPKRVISSSGDIASFSDRWAITWWQQTNPPQQAYWAKGLYHPLPV